MYEPQVNDYVRWTTALGMVHEGWVYFKCDYTPKKKGFPQTEHYITIELGVIVNQRKNVRRVYIRRIMYSYCAIIINGMS